LPKKCTLLFGHVILTRQNPFNAIGVSITEFIKSLREADNAPFRPARK
jgi:hypothetical protein